MDNNTAVSIANEWSKLNARHHDTYKRLIRTLTASVPDIVAATVLPPGSVASVVAFDDRALFLITVDAQEDEDEAVGITVTRRALRAEHVVISVGNEETRDESEHCRATCRRWTFSWESFEMVVEAVLHRAMSQRSYDDADDYGFPTDLFAVALAAQMGWHVESRTPPEVVPALFGGTGELPS